MSKKFIIFGVINKRFLLPFFLALSEIIYILFNKFYPITQTNLILQTYSMATAEMSIKLLPCILKIENETNSKEKKLTFKTKLLHYTILTAIYIVNTGINSIADLFDYYVNGKQISYSGSNIFPNNDLILMSIEMILMIFISKCLLKYKYYKHHVISTIVFIIFGITSELCLEKYFTTNVAFFISKGIRLVGTAVDATYYCFQKFMMEKHFYPYWNLAFIPGIVMFLLSTSLLIIVLINPDKENSGTPFIRTFYSYFITDNLTLPILKVVIVFIIHFIMCPLAILNVYYFNPNFILIIFQFSRITKNIINNSKSKLYCLVFYFIQLFALTIHLEILELNFCELNRFTKRNIDLRGIDDALLERNNRTMSANSIDIDEGYSIAKQENDDNRIIEMKEQEEEIDNQ